ncbi:2-oxoglutarate dehydrogenase E1 subunit family protein, partial [Cellulomonas sp. P5_C6]
MADPDSTRAVFGANEWLVDELYEQYLQDKNTVDPAWWDFFEGYKPDEASTNGSTPAPAPTNGVPATKPTPVVPAPAAAAAPAAPPAPPA